MRKYMSKDVRLDNEGNRGTGDPFFAILVSVGLLLRFDVQLISYMLMGLLVDGVVVQTMHGDPGT